MSAVYSIEDKVLFDKYYKSMCYYAYTLLHDYDLSEDFVQDAFIAYLKKKDELAKDENIIKSYLYSSIKNNIFNWSRRGKVQKKYWDRTGFVEHDDVDMNNIIIKTEVLTAINDIIKELPDSCQTIFKLSYIEGLGNQEIADLLNLSVNTIKTQKRRGLKYVQSKLNPEFFLYVPFFFLIK